MRARSGTSRTRYLFIALVAFLALSAITVVVEAQRGRGGFGRRNREPITTTKVPYDGRFTFARIAFTLTPEAGYDVKWAHDYPRAERNFMQLLRELTTLRPYMDGGTVISLDDPDLFKFPVAYFSEPGFWDMDDAEVAALRAYVQKGGFMIFDDFAGGHWYNFERQMRRVLPDVRMVRLDATHPIFDSFFRIPDLEYRHPYYNVTSEFWGIYADNDPSQRLVAIINYNNDVGEYWEFSDQGFFPVDMSNTAYKLGVNYIIYAMTH